jgi:hypothetical protein
MLLGPVYPEGLALQSGSMVSAALRAPEEGDIIHITMKAPVSYLFTGLLLLASAGAVAQTAAYAEIVYSQGEDLVVLSSGKQRTLKDPIGERLSAGDQIQTGSKTTVELVLMPRRSRLRLSENTVATIRELSTEGATGIELLYGRLRSKVERMTAREEQFNVRAPSVVAAVRGTDFGCDVILYPSGKTAPTKVYCFEGSVDVSTPLSPAGAAPVAVGAGSMAVVSLSAEGSAPSIAKSSIDGDTLKFWKANEFTEKLPKEAAQLSTAPRQMPAFDLEPIRKGIAAKNAAIIGSGALFIAGAALGGTGFYFRDSNPDLSDTLLLSGALTAALAIPSLVLAISIDPLSKAGNRGE